MNKPNNFNATSINDKTVSRRDFLKLAGASAGTIALSSIMVNDAQAASGSLPIEQHRALLYDATICVGCKECEVACKRDNNLPEEQVDDLAGDTFTIIKKYEAADGSETSFRKFQCMHCVDPACAASCPVSALHKLDDGPVVYDSYKCIGCRYCMQACPYGVPRYDWSLAYPLIRKCDLCFDREDGTACALACPTGALIAGRRGDLLNIAHERIAANPGKYHADRVFGENDGGGTSVLLLTPVSFDKIGLPPLDQMPLPDRTQWALKIVPAIFFGVGGVMSAIYKSTKDKPNGDQEAAS